MLRLQSILVLVAGLVTPLVGQGENQCPTISVFGPAGIVKPGGLFDFTASIKPEFPMNGIKFEWTIQGGKIIGASDTKIVKVRPEKYFNKSTTAIVKVLGLPNGCSDTASGSTGIVCDSYLILGDGVVFWTEYGESSWSEEREKLDSLSADGLRKHPLNTIYLEISFRKDISKQHVAFRLGQIRNYLMNVRKLRKNRFFIRAFRGEKNQTRGYLVPADAPVLDPNYSNPCLQ